MAKRVMNDKIHFNGKPCKTCGATLRYLSGGKQCVACSRRVKYNYRKSDIGIRTEREWRLRKSYGIGIDDYNNMYKKQNGKCLICGCELKEGGWGDKSVAIDHNHKTGTVRGLLCNVCNRGIGMFNDDTKLLMSAIKYLELDE